MATRTKVLINNKKHPHYNTIGYLTGKIIDLFGTKMAEVELLNDKYGEEGCFVKKEDILILGKE
jgi:hypothetical protein